MKVEPLPTPCSVETMHYSRHLDLKFVTFPVAMAALDALAEADVSVEIAVKNLSPWSEEDCEHRIKCFYKRAQKGMWGTRKILDWMQTAIIKKDETVSLTKETWGLVEKAAAAVGITPADWLVHAIGYRAVLETRKKGDTAIAALWDARKSEMGKNPPGRNTSIAPAPIENHFEQNTLIFHKCLHCPHGLKPWDAPRNAS